MGGLNNAQLNAVLSSGGLNLYSARQPYYTALIFNQGAPVRLPFFRDELVRKALTMALDRESLVTQTLAREAIPTNSTILSGTWAYNRVLTPQPVDVAQAAALLDQAGYPLQGGVRTNAEGVKLSFTLIVTDGAVERQIGQAAVDAWRGLGVDAKMP
jgi:peptide/nickel transport system substrate-binding protein